MQHTQTHYNTSDRYIIIITHASNIWSRAAVKTFYSFLDLTEDCGYFSARPWAYKYNTTTNAIHTPFDLAIIVRTITKRKKSRKITQRENRLSGQNHKKANSQTNSQTKKNKNIRNQTTAKNVRQAAPPQKKN